MFSQPDSKCGRSVVSVASVVCRSSFVARRCRHTLVQYGNPQAHEREARRDDARRRRRREGWARGSGEREARSTACWAKLCITNRGRRRYVSRSAAGTHLTTSVSVAFRPGCARVVAHDVKRTVAPRLDDDAALCGVRRKLARPARPWRRPPCIAEHTTS